MTEGEAIQLLQHIQKTNPRYACFIRAEPYDGVRASPHDIYPSTWLVVVLDMQTGQQFNVAGGINGTPIRSSNDRTGGAKVIMRTQHGGGQRIVSSPPRN